MDGEELSVLARFDDICRGFNFWMNEPSREFQTFAASQEECRKKWMLTEEVCSRVQKELSETRANKEKLELQVRHVTELLKNEIQIRQRLQKEEKDLEKKLNMVKQIVSSDRNLTEETRDRLVSISSIDSYYRAELESPGDQLVDTTSEIESSTRSILSSLDITSEKTDEDLELSMVRSIRDVRARPSSSNLLKVPHLDYQPPIAKRNRQNASVTALTSLAAPTVIATPGTPGTPAASAVPAALSVASAITPSTVTPTAVPSVSCSGGSGFLTPKGIRYRFSVSSSSGNSQDRTPTNENRRTLSAKRIVRQHNFAIKVVLKQELCIPCQTRIRFGKSAMKCIDCLGTCHVECKTVMPTPCVPTVRTPSHFVGSIADYSPKTSPMIPSLMVHCLNEIEARGLTESSIYRVGVPEKDVHLLKEELLHGRIRHGQMNNYDIHVIAAVVKSFLSSLKEPLVTYTSRESFIKIGYIHDDTDVQTAVCSLVPDLPQPNRDTLAYLILHLQRVVENQNSRMSVSILAKTFAPMVIGHPHPAVEDGLKKLQNVKEQHKAMEKLINIPSDYWNCYGKYMETAVTPIYKGHVSGRITTRTGFFTSPHF